MIRHLAWIARHHFDKSFDEETCKTTQKEIFEAMLTITQDLPAEKLSNKEHQISDDDEDENVYQDDPIPSSASPGTKRSNDFDSEETSTKKQKTVAKKSHQVPDW